MMMIRKNTLLSTLLPTFFQNARLLSNMSKPTNDLLIAIIESEHGIRNIHILTKLLDKLLRLAQIMSRNTRIQMMNRLELKSTVEKVQPGRTVHVHGCAEHLLGERLPGTEIGGRHRVVREGNLHMEWCGDHVGYQDKGNSIPPAGDAEVDHTVAEPGPEEDLTGKLEPAVPPAGAVAGSAADDDVFPAEEVEIETAEEDNGVVEVVLVLDCDLSHGVVCHDPVVVCAA